MPDVVIHILVVITRWLEITGASALILGFVVATVQLLRRASREGAMPAYEAYRRTLGRVVLVGLEILVAATIIKTITVDPTPQALGLLALMIGIRTTLGWATVLEMEGRWPWTRKPAQAPAESGGDPSA
jgi:uncharacterized membrane protein